MTIREIGGSEEKPGRVMWGKGKPREKYQYNNATQESPFWEIERQNDSRNKAKRKRHGLKLTSVYPGLTQQLESSLFTPLCWGLLSIGIGTS